MIVLQILGIPIIAILLVGAIFVIGSTGVEHPDYPRWDDQSDARIDIPDSIQPLTPPGLPRHGCNL